MRISLSAATAAGRSIWASGPWACTRSAPRSSIRRYWRIWAGWRAGTTGTATMTETAGSRHQESAAPPAGRKTFWAWTVATFFGAGLGKPGPGTWGSVAAVLLWAAFAWMLHPSAATLAIALIAGIVLSLAAGVPAATIAARESG